MSAMVWGDAAWSALTATAQAVLGGLLALAKFLVTFVA